MRRLLIYSQDGTGLGHLRRATTIAREVLARVPTCSVLVLGDSPALPFFRARPGLDYVKLPTLIKAGRLEWHPLTLHEDVEAVTELRSELIARTFATFRPDAVLVDHMPVGALGELKATLELAAGCKRPPKLFLGLRDILDSPGAIRHAWTTLGVDDYLPVYDHVLVYGCEEVYDAVAAYDLEPLGERVTYCGYVAPRREAGRDADADTSTVLVMGGGGGDAFPMARCFLEALAVLGPDAGIRARVLAGPNMPAAERSLLAALADETAADVEREAVDATEALRRASAVVTMAGYNSLCEVLAYEKRALVLPRRGPSAEQSIRARLFADLGLVRALDDAPSDPARLACGLLELLADRDLPHRANIPPLDGAQRAARLLLDATGGRDAAGSRVPAGRRGGA